MEHTVSSFFDKLSFILSYFTRTVSGERKALLLARLARREMPKNWKFHCTSCKRSDRPNFSESHFSFTLFDFGANWCALKSLEQPRIATNHVHPFTGRNEPEFTWMHNTCGRNGARGGKRPSGIDSPFAIFRGKTCFSAYFGHNVSTVFFFG